MKLCWYSAPENDDWAEQGQLGREHRTPYWRERKTCGRGENMEVGEEGRGEKEKRPEGALNASTHCFLPFTGSSSSIPLYLQQFWT